MADTLDNIARCDIAISSPKDQRQKQPVIISELSDTANHAGVVEKLMVAASPTDAPKMSDQTEPRLVIEIPDGESAYEVSLSACRRAHARYSTGFYV